MKQLEEVLSENDNFLVGNNNHYIVRGQIYYADLGETKGSEQGGIRPVLILQNNTGNKYSPTVIVASITSQIGKANIPTHVPISGFGLSENSIILLEQITTLSKKHRLKGYIGTINKETMDKVNKACLISLGLTA